MAESILESAQTAFRHGDFDHAKSLCQSALSSSDAPQSDYSELFFLTVECLRIQGDSHGASRLLDEAPDLMKESQQGSLLLQMHRGYLLGTQSRFAEALKLLTDAELASQNGNLDSLLGDIRLRKAMVLFFASDYNASEKLYRSTLEHAVQAKDEYRQLLANAGIGKNNMIRGKFRVAIGWFQQALSIAQATDESFLAATMKSELGWCFYNLDENDNAMDLFRQAESAFANSGAKHNYGICLANIGNVYYKQGDYASAVNYYERALAIAREIGDKISTEKWLKNLSIAFSRMGDADAASKYDLEAMQAKLQVESERLRAKEMQK